MLNRKDLEKKIQEACGYHLYEVQDVMQAFLAVLRQELKDGGSVQLFGTGVLKIKPMETRQHNSFGGASETTYVGPSVKFAVSRTLREEIKREAREGLDKP